MRFSAPLLLALPLLGAAAESPFEQYKAQFQNFLGSFGSFLQTPQKEAEQPKTPADAAAAAAAAEPQVGSGKMDVLTLENWKETLYSPVKPDATTPEEWWVLITGRNKTCFGHCLKVESAFNETVDRFATLPKAPHMGYLNCDDQPVLCNSWSAGTGQLWVFEMLPPPAKTDIYIKRLNLTTTTSKTLLELYGQDSKEGYHLHDGYFHPLDGPLATRGLAVPIGYALWALNVIPSWAMMLGISFLSRTMMNRRMGPQNNQRAGAAPRAAPAGDAAGAR